MDGQRARFPARHSEGRLALLTPTGTNRRDTFANSIIFRIFVAL